MTDPRSIADRSPRLAASLRLDDPLRAAECIDRAVDAGYEKLVLEPPLHRETWSAVRAHAPRDAIAAMRLFLPSSADSRPSQPPQVRWGSLDRAERRSAIARGLDTLAEADRAGCPLVLAPIVRLDDESLAAGPVDARLAVSLDPAIRKQRRAEAEARLAAVLATLEPLLSKAERYAITIAIGVTNRPRELPLVEEADRVLHEFAGAPLGLWLDTARFPAELVEVPDLGRTQGAPKFRAAGSVRGLTARSESIQSARDVAEVVLRQGLARAPMTSVDLGANASGAALTEAREVIEAILHSGGESAKLPLFGV